MSSCRGGVTLPGLVDRISSWCGGRVRRPCRGLLPTGGQRTITAPALRRRDPDINEMISTAPQPSSDNRADSASTPIVVLRFYRRSRHHDLSAGNHGAAGGPTFPQTWLGFSLLRDGVGASGCHRHPTRHHLADLSD